MENATYSEKMSWAATRALRIPGPHLLCPDRDCLGLLVLWISTEAGLLSYYEDMIQDLGAIFLFLLPSRYLPGTYGAAVRSFLWESTRGVLRKLTRDTFSLRLELVMYLPVFRVCVYVCILIIICFLVALLVYSVNISPSSQHQKGSSAY